MFSYLDLYEAAGDLDLFERWYLSRSLSDDGDFLDRLAFLSLDSISRIDDDDA